MKEFEYGFFLRIEGLGCVEEVEEFEEVVGEEEEGKEVEVVVEKLGLVVVEVVEIVCFILGVF